MKPDYFVELLKKSTLPQDYRNYKPIKYTHATCGWVTLRITEAYVHLAECKLR